MRVTHVRPVIPATHDAARLGECPARGTQIDGFDDVPANWVPDSRNTCGRIGERRACSRLANTTSYPTVPFVPDTISLLLFPFSLPPTAKMRKHILCR